MSGNRKRKKMRDRNVFHRRKDMITRLLVDLGINYLPTLGREKATEFLHENNVPDKVTTRVLSSPQSRRSY